MWGVFLFLLITELSPSSYSGMPACVFYLSLRYIILLTFKFKIKKKKALLQSSPNFLPCAGNFPTLQVGNPLGSRDLTFPRSTWNAVLDQKADF